MSNTRSASRIMTSTVSLALAAVSMIVFVANGHSQQKFSKTVLQPALWEKMKYSAKEECGDGLQDCAGRFLVQNGVVLGSRPIYEFFTLGESRGRNLTVAFVTLKVDDDDSLAGIRYRLVMSLGDVEDNTYKLENMGRQYTCARGHKYWSKKRCP